MYEIRPSFSGELKPVKVDVQFLASRIQSSLDELMGRSIKSVTVDVHSRETLNAEPEWRINIAPREPRIYSAVSALIEEANSYYREFVRLGTMRPQLFTVTVWAIKASEPSIKGSFD